MHDGILQLSQNWWKILRVYIVLLGDVGFWAMSMYTSRSPLVSWYERRHLPSFSERTLWRGCTLQADPLLSPLLYLLCRYNKKHMYGKKSLSLQGEFGGPIKPRLRAVSFLSSVSHARVANVERRSRETRETRAFPVSRLQSRTCVFSHVLFDGLRKKRDCS